MTFTIMHYLTIWFTARKSDSGIVEYISVFLFSSLFSVSFFLVSVAVYRGHSIYYGVHIILTFTISNFTISLDRR